MSKVLEYIKIALMNIKSNKGRSFLTMLGIIIGISSVIMIIAIGNGVSREINSELDNLAGGQLFLSVDSTRKDTTISFVEEDFDFLKEKIPNIKGVTMSVSALGTAEGAKGNIDAKIFGGTADYQYTTSDPLIKGQYFTQGDYQSANPVCVINEGGARALFGNNDVVGMSFDLTMYGITKELTIVGVREDNASLIVVVEGDIQIELPASVMEAGYGLGMEYFSEILIVANSAIDTAEVAGRAIKLLESKYDVRGEEQIQVRSFTDVSSQFNRILGMVTLFISLVAAISLLVGGIGVMNIMLVSVTERTREIGIRKALGARTSSIMLQFLAEAGIITLIGGVIGIILGYIGGSLVCSIIDIVPQVDLTIVMAATFFSSVVGIFFGIYPARKATKLSPIEALRHE